MKINPFAGKPSEASENPDPSVPLEPVAFGTSGYRGLLFDKALHEWYILASSQAICLYRKQQIMDGPLFLGLDTHAPSVPALAGAYEVLAAKAGEGSSSEEGDARAA